MRFENNFPIVSQAKRLGFTHLSPISPKKAVWQSPTASVIPFNPTKKVSCDIKKKSNKHF
jgi:hypothetical protein